MPGRLFLTTPVADLATLAGVPPVAEDGPRTNIQPGQEVLALTSDGLTHMRWGLLPVGRVNARGRPVMQTLVNARSETLFDKSAFDGLGRAVVPADGWYEWTGPARRKTAHRIARADGAPLWFAAVWDRWQAPGGAALAQLATVTCAPNAEVAPIHDRMGVLLDTGDLLLWLSGTRDEVCPLLRPLADGFLQVSDAGDVDWSSP